MVNDPIADFLIRIKNGYLAKKKEIQAPYSKIKEEIGRILENEGYIKKFKVQSSKFKVKKGEKKKILIINLKYKGGKAAIEEVKRISKPGTRVYVDSKHIPRVLSGYGMAIISTSMGLMTDKETRKKGLGGEVICKVW